MKCSNSSQHEIYHKIKGVNDHNGETQEEENVNQDDRKAENETQECDFMIHKHNRNDEEHLQIKEDTRIEKEKVAEPKNNKEEEIETNGEIFMVELQSEHSEKKAEVVGKADTEEQAIKEQTVNKRMILIKDVNLENTKSEGEGQREDEQYGKPSQQCQKLQKVIAGETKTKEKKKGQKIDHKLTEEEQTENRKQLKRDDTDKTIKTSSQNNKQKEITLRKNDEREKNSGKTKPQNITEESEKDIYIGCNKYVETGAQCESCYRWYHYKCEGTTEKKIKKLYPE